MGKKPSKWVLIRRLYPRRVAEGLRTQKNNKIRIKICFTAAGVAVNLFVFVKLLNEIIRGSIETFMGLARCFN